MIKKVLPAAILAAFAGAASADASLYGVIDFSVGKNEYAGDTKVTLHSGGDSGQSQGNSTTRIGVKGSNDVGNGVKANFKFETNGITSSGNVNNANTAFFNRQAWFGLSGGFGEVRAGRQDSVPFQVMGQFDFNGMSNGVTSGYSGVAVWGWNIGRQSRALQYIAPEMNGFKAQLGIVPEDVTVAGSKATYSGGATYAMGDLSVGASFQTKSTANGENFASAAASYDLKVAKVMAGFTKDSGTDGPTLGVMAPVGPYTVGAHLASAKVKATDVKTTATELFVNREIFKDTYGYAEFGSAKTDGNDRQNSYAVGVIYVF